MMWAQYTSLRQEACWGSQETPFHRSLLAVAPDRPKVAAPWFRSSLTRTNPWRRAGAPVAVLGARRAATMPAVNASTLPRDGGKDRHLSTAWGAVLTLTVPGLKLSLPPATLPLY